MPAKKSEALVLRRFEYSETSYVVVLYSRDFGKVRAIAKGWRRSPSKGSLDPLTYCGVVYYEGGPGRLGTVAEVEVRETFPLLRTNLAGLYAALHATEIVESLTADAEPDPELFDLLRELLYNLAGGAGAPLAIVAFAARALRLLGYLPLASGCAVCGGQLPREGRVRFSSDAGGGVCDGCADEALVDGAATERALKTLESLARRRVRPVRIPDDLLDEIKEILKCYVTYLMGREPRTLRYV